jgi:hypothetical protein
LLGDTIEIVVFYGVLCFDLQRQLRKDASGDPISKGRITAIGKDKTFQGRQNCPTFGGILLSGC